MTQLSGPVNKRPFSTTEWRYTIGNEPGIKEDVDGSAYDLSFSTSSDEAMVGSNTEDSVSVVGGGVHVIPVADREPIVIPEPSSAARTDLLVVRHDPAWGVLPVDPAVDPAGAAAHVGPCRLYRIPGVEGAKVPTYDGGPPGPEDMVLWEVTRKPGEPLAQATKVDRRIRTGPNLLVPDAGTLPTSVPLGTRARAADTGAEYVLELDGQGAPKWRPAERVEAAGAMYGTYTGQPVRRRYHTGTASPDGNGDAILLANQAFAGGGVLHAIAAAAGQFQVDISCRMEQGNVVMRAWDANGLIVRPRTYAFTAETVRWTA